MGDCFGMCSRRKLKKSGNERISFGMNCCGLTFNDLTAIKWVNYGF